MTAASVHPDGSAPVPDLLVQFRVAVAEDLRILARLHGSELDRDLLIALKHIDDDDLLGLRLQQEGSRGALDLLRAGLDAIPDPGDDADATPVLEQLAADYADIYLNHSLRAAPSESVWLDPDNLAMQEPMFGCRDWYRGHGLAAPDWRHRPDDHLVHQLQFIAHLMDPREGADALADAARFMDEHLLRWIAPFAERVACRSRSRLYAGLATLTAAYLGELRELLDAISPAADQHATDGGDVPDRPEHEQPQTVGATFSGDST